LRFSRGNYEEKREKRDREVGGSERHYEWREQNISSLLKVPRPATRKSDH
jgi:hypothetical protein